MKDEGFQPPHTSLCPPGFIVLSFFSKALVCGGVRRTWGLPTWLAVGARRGPEAEEGRGLQEQSSSPRTHFSFPSLVYPAWKGFVL